jgi:hypothetical protein
MDLDKPMIPVFDWRDIKPEHQQAAQEIADMMESVNEPMLAELIRQKFKVTPPTRFDFKESQFVQECQKNNIGIMIQGFVDDNGVQIPLVMITEDVRRLDQFINNVKKTA